MSLLCYDSKFLASLQCVLASKSPRRKEILETMGLRNIVLAPSKFEENLPKTMTPKDYCLATANAKGLDVHNQIESKQYSVLISADTILELESEIIEKPKDKEDAFNMLRKLSGKTHFVHTGVCLFTPSETSAVSRFVSTTAVEFGELSDEEIRNYVATGEPMDKAGGYGIQSLGAHLIRRIEGCYYNVMGLPLRDLSVALADLHTKKLI